MLAAELMQIIQLDLAGRDISVLQAGDFSGLIDLLSLNLSNNFIETLPANIFLGLTGLGDFLGSVLLNDNPGAPFELVVRPEFGPTSALDGFTGTTVKLTLREGAPRRITVALSAAGGTTVSADSLTIPAGHVESDVTEITRASSNVPFQLILGAITLGGDNRRYLGINIVTGEPVGAPSVNICGRTSLVQTGILRETTTDGDTCDAVLASELASISRLSFSSSGIMSLRPGDFSGLTGLRTLDLTRNSLSTLPATVFSELTGLRTLDLTRNSLSTLPATVFSRLTNLRTLDLGSNNLSVLSDDVFSELTGLQTLNLAGNTLERLPDGIFSESTGLQTLDLGSNNLGVLSGDVFSELTDLRTLDMSSNRLSMLPASIFTGPTALQSLDLRDNNLGTLPDDVFSRLTNLQTLNLARNQLTELPAGAFAGLAGLTEVYMAGNPSDNPSTITLTVRARFNPSRLPDDFSSATVKLTLREGAPRPITVGLSPTGAELSAFSLTIPTGAVESDASVMITRGSGPFELILGPVTLGGTDADYSGFEIVVPESPTTISGGVRLRLRMFLEGALE